MCRGARGPIDMDRAALPKRLSEVISELEAELEQHCPGAVDALLIYGDLARSGPRTASAEAHLMVQLSQTAAERLAQVAVPLTRAWRMARIHPYLVGAGELPRMADVFPVKVLDIKRHHLLLTGEDPLADVKIHGEHLRLQVEQLLRNQLMRLRRGFVGAWNDAGSMMTLLVRAVHTLHPELEALLLLLDQDPGGGVRAEVFDRVASTCELDREVMACLDSLEREGPGSARQVLELAGETLSLLEWLVDIADRLEVPAWSC